MSADAKPQRPPPPKREAEVYRPKAIIGDKYRLVRQLGEGGMAEVWVAHDLALDIDVAVKFIRADLRGARGADDRMLQEARAAAKLGHSAIVRVSDFGLTSRGNPFLAMELLHGEDLYAELTSRGRLSPVRAVATLLPIAHALAAAHDAGIIHRDLKPENVFIASSSDGRVQPKLLDFGIAKQKQEPEQFSKRLTQDGAIVGSPAYMSPETARGEPIDHRADIWSFCVVLYETITGELPFDGPNYQAIMMAIIEDSPRSSLAEIGQVDPALQAILDRGLAKDREVRWPSMRDLPVSHTSGPAMVGKGEGLGS